MVKSLSMAPLLRLLPGLVFLSLACASCASMPFFGSQALNTESSTATQTKSASAPLQAAGSLPPPKTYDLQDNKHQVWARLTQIAYTEDSIIVTMAITNGSKEVVQLSAKEDMILCDDLKQASHYICGNEYRLSAPPDNLRVSIQPGTTMKGQFVFIGRLSPQAKFLKLTTNSSASASYSTLPKLEFVDIPIQR